MDTPQERAAVERVLAAVCTTPDCVAGLDFEVLRVTRGIQAGRLSINADAVDACLVVRPNVYVFDSRITGPPPECDDLWVPLTPLGGACDTDFDCINGFCERSNYSRSRPEYAAGGCGICAPRGAQGALCSSHGWTGADRECAPGLQCGCPDGTDQCDTTCQAYAAAGMGERCVAPHIECAESLACVYQHDGLDGTCQPTLAPGAPCTSDDVCRDALCLDLDASGVGHCGPRQTGEACAGVDECATGSVCDMVCAPPRERGEACQSSEQCEGGNECVDGTCRLILGLGAACDPSPTSTDRCATGATCLGGVCAPLRLGDACNAECASGTCQNGRCVSLAPGAACTADGAWSGDPCGSGLECGRSKTCEARPALGAPCSSEGYCDSGHFCSMCDDSAECSGNGTCEEICVLGEADGGIR